MSRYINGKSAKAGLPPGTVIHIGAQRTEKVTITVFDYDEAHCVEKTLETVEECFSFEGTLTVSWINLSGVHQIGVIDTIGKCFNLHPLTVEDIVNTGQRSKLEDYGDYLYIVMKMLYSNEEDHRVQAEQVSLVVGSHYVISFLERESGIFTGVRERVRTGKGNIRKRGADYLAYALIDAIVDNYFVILEKLGEELESAEEEVVSNPTPDVLREIHRLRGEMIFLRRAVWPLREVISWLERGESPLIQKSTRLFLRDVYDHTIQVIETIETSRDIVSGMVETYLSSVNNKMNEVVKVLTIIATIFIPLTFIAGIYGMNFKYMPELEWRWGYLLVWIVMIVVAVAMVYCFKRKRWL